MANTIFIEVDYGTLLAFANGTSIEGRTISSPASPPVIDIGPALSTCESNGWTIVAFSAAPKQIWILGHS